MDVDLIRAIHVGLNHFSDDMEDGISLHWWYKKSNPNKVGIDGSVEFLTVSGNKIHEFNPDFGQELKLNFRVD